MPIMGTNSKALKSIKEYRKRILIELYNQCTKPQQDFFNRMYGSIKIIADNKIDWAIQQCESTIKKNKSGAYLKITEQ